MNERIDSIQQDTERRIQSLMEGVQTLHSGVDTELHQGLRELRDRVEALRKEGSIGLDDFRRAVAACQEELRRLDDQVDDLRERVTTSPVSPGPTETVPSFPLPSAQDESRTERVDVSSEPDPAAVSMQTLFSTLTKAALISTAEMRCHRHTWAFIVRHTVRDPLIHELLPDPESGNEHGTDDLLTAHLSGPVLMGVLNALHQTRHDRPADRLTREHIQEIALAGALFDRISENINKASGPDEGSAARTQIVFDDRPAPAAALDPPPDQPEPAEPDTHRSDPAPPPSLYRINGQILQVRHPLYCVARKTNSERCRNPLEYGETGTWIGVPTANGAEVGVYDVGDNPRWMSQHCTLHEAPGTEDFCPPQWRPYDPETGS